MHRKATVLVCVVSLALLAVPPQFLAQSRSSLDSSDGDSIEQIFGALVRCAGGHGELPLQHYRDESKGPAYYRSGQIFVHSGLTDVLEGERWEDAMAFVLAHELAHHNRNHICSNFVKKASKGTEWEEDRTSRERKLADSQGKETEADIYAGLYGHMAGYRPLDVAEETLDRIYAAYDIPDSLPGYPTLEERKTMASQSREQLNQIAQVYDAAWIALATGEYAAADFLLTTIVVRGEYSAPEVHGLLALAQFLDVVHSLGREEFKQWSWPINMQRDTEAKTRSMSREDQVWAVSKLNEALEHAAKANDKNVGRDALDVEQNGWMETGLEASLLWLKTWVSLDGKATQHADLQALIESKGQGGNWDETVTTNLMALSFWMEGKGKKARKELEQVQSMANALNILAIGEEKAQVNYQSLGPCEGIQMIEQEAVSRSMFRSDTQMEKVSVAGKKVLTKQSQANGITDLNLKMGKEALALVVLNQDALQRLCWGVVPDMTMDELIGLFPDQRKTVIQLQLGSILCLPDEHLAFQFNARSELSFVAMSLE